MTSTADRFTDRSFDASTELVAALARSVDRLSDARSQRVYDTDLTGRGEDFWAEFGTMIYECRSGIDIARNHPRFQEESWPSWLGRIRKIYLGKYLYEAIKALDSISYKTDVAHFRSLDSREVLHIATSFVPCEQHNAAIEALDDEEPLMRVVRDAACNGAKRHAARRLSFLFPERKDEFERLVPAEEKQSFADRVAPSAERDHTRSDFMPVELPCGVVAEDVVSKALQDQGEEATRNDTDRDLGRRKRSIGSRLTQLLSRALRRR